MPTSMIIAHGGVGARAEWSDGCQQACTAGAHALEAADALAAVVAAGRVLEDDPRFNAGTGALLRLDGRCELDASVMTDDGRYGAVACLSGVRYPIEVALAVLATPHHILCGEGANQFARAKNFAPYSPVTPRSLERLARDHARLETDPLKEVWRDAEFSGTIGAVARSSDGRFAVSCSTGGRSFMLPGRVGDSPICGAGVYAGPLGAICCTGAGERILTRLTAYRVYARIEAGEDLIAACQAEVDAIPDDASIGIIAVTAEQDAVVADRSMPSARWSPTP